MLRGPDLDDRQERFVVDSYTNSSGFSVDLHDQRVVERHRSHRQDNIVTNVTLHSTNREQTCAKPRRTGKTTQLISTKRGCGTGVCKGVHEQENIVSEGGYRSPSTSNRLYFVSKPADHEYLSTTF